MKLADEGVVSNVTQLVGPLGQSDPDNDNEVIKCYSKLFLLLHVSHQIRVQLLTELLAHTLIHGRVHLNRESPSSVWHCH